MTLAHEMGHGVLGTGQHNGYLMSDTPLTLAETASVFAEMLAFRVLLESTDNPANRLFAGRKGRGYAEHSSRQIAFNFETTFHNARRSGEVSGEQLSDIWMDTQRAALGPAVRLTIAIDLYGPIFHILFIAHFMSMPMRLAIWLMRSGRAIRAAAMKHARNLYQLSRPAGSGRNGAYDSAQFHLDATQPEFWYLGWIWCPV